MVHSDQRVLLLRKSLHRRTMGLAWSVIRVLADDDNLDAIQRRRSGPCVDVESCSRMMCSVRRRCGERAESARCSLTWWVDLAELFGLLLLLLVAVARAPAYAFSP